MLKKRFIAMMVIVGLLVCSPASFVCEAKFVLPEEGRQDGAAYPSRSEVVAAFVQAVGLDVSKAALSVLAQFQDAGKIATAYQREIAAAVEAGMISGYDDNTFRPDAKITRTEALVILNRTLQRRTLPGNIDLHFVDTPIWAEEEIERLAAAGVVKGYGNGYLGAGDYLTWEQVTILTQRAARMAGPAGNYYEYANEDWLIQTQIPEGYVVWSNIYAIDREVMQEVGDIIYSLYQKHAKDGSSFPPGSSEQKIVDVFTASGNTVHRDRLGLAPVAEYLKKIDGARTTKELLRVMAELETSGFHGLLPMTVGVDIYDSSKYRLTHTECYTGVHTELIKGDGKETVMAAYENYLAKLFALHGKDRPHERGTAVAALCQRLAEISLPLQEQNEIEKYYMIFDQETLDTIFTNFSMIEYLAALGFSDVDTMVLYDLELAREINRVFVPENLELLKDYLRVCVMDGSAMYLNSDAFAVWNQYQNELNQREIQAMPGDYAVETTVDLLGWDVAKLYTAQYASAETKAAVERMTRDILQAYQKRIRQNLWMSQSGKDAALKKLQELQLRIGYPEDIDTYPDDMLQIRSVREGGNLIEYRSNYWKRYYEIGAQKMKKGIAAREKNSWSMLPQTVNAMYDPSSNSITIPAGILRAPFYDPRVSREQNLGGIGSVIAHEISHAFDAVGAKFDEDGNLENWWNQQDREVFQRICDQVVTAYDEIEVYPGQYVDGRLTMSENMADLAGMGCILDVAGEGNPRMGDLFKGYAAVWRMKAGDAYRKTMLQIDTHAPEEVRVNRVLSNFSAFSNYYDLQEGDGMYLPEEKRIQIWGRGL